MTEARTDQTSYPDRRARRRQQTIEEILDRAMDLMTADGVGSLTMSGLARAMAIQPPSLYKYFASVRAVYEELFARGQQENRDVFVHALQTGPPGLSGLTAALEAVGRWAVEHPVLAQLLFWRPVPGFVPGAEALAPAGELVELLRGSLREAAARGEIDEAAASDDGLASLAVLHFGVLSQHLANEPGLGWDEGTFTRQHARVLAMFVRAYPAPPPPARIAP